MNTASWVAFQMLLSQRGLEKKAALSRYFTPEDEKYLAKTPTPCNNPFKHPLSLKERIEKIHYSWFIPFIEPFSETDKVTILSAFDPKQSKKLKDYFHIKEDLSLLSPHGKNYLHETFFSWITSNQKAFIPIELLPDHPLNWLLTIQKGEIQTFVDYLGLHDLATEMKHLIQTSQIKKIQRALSRPKQSYVQILLKKREQVLFTRLHLDNWDGDETKLKRLLHQRGLNRLGKALFGCSPFLLWHLCHKLDTGRSKILHKFFTSMNNEEAQKKLIHQLTELKKFIKSAL